MWGEKSVLDYFLRSGLWRIEPAGMPGMTAQQPPDGKQTAAPGAMALNGFHGVMGATGIKPAVIAEQWT